MSKDYRDDHSPDIALLLTLAEVVRHLCQGPGSNIARDAIDKALKPFERYPDPIETQEPE